MITLTRSPFPCICCGHLIIIVIVVSLEMSYLYAAAKPDDTAIKPYKFKEVSDDEIQG